MKLPPLNAIKAFEVTARCGGFTAAANELGVSAAAVSLQVRKAEEFLGKQLFLRHNNSLTLTDAGRMLYPQVAQSLSGLASITDQFLENEASSRLVISTIQSLAEKWVVPAIARFRLTHPEVGVALLIENDPVDFTRQKTDIRLTYGNQHYPHMHSTLMFQDSLAPLCTPDFAEQHDFELSNISDEKLIHIDWGEAYASYPTWAAWFRKSGIPRFPDLQKGLRVAGTGVAIEMAAQGAGVALASLQLSAHHLASGDLVQLEQNSISMTFGYYAITASPDKLDNQQTQNATYTEAFLQEITRGQV